jgi:hypothetical protein
MRKFSTVNGLEPGAVVHAAQTARNLGRKSIFRGSCVSPQQDRADSSMESVRSEASAGRTASREQNRIDFKTRRLRRIARLDQMI